MLKTHVIFPLCNPNQVGPDLKPVPSEEEETSLPYVGPHPDFSKKYNFKDKVEWLPFHFHHGNAPFSKEQQDMLQNLVYVHKEDFSLHDDLRFCNKLIHMMPRTTDKLVYMAHRTIP